MELAIVNKTSLPKLDTWTHIFRTKIKELQNGEKVIMITLKNNEPYHGLETAWRRVVYAHNHKPRVKTVNHQLGHTIYLWWE